MAIYAVINDGIIENMIVADATFAAGVSADHVVLVDGVTPQPAIGWLYDEGTEEFTDPNPPEA